MAKLSAGVSYPLVNTIEEPPIPIGYIKLDIAVDAVGNEVFPEDWTGAERGYFKTGFFNQQFRSKIEYEADSAFRAAALFAQCELVCQRSGKDPHQMYERLKTPVKNDETFVPVILPELPADNIKELEKQFSKQIIAAMIVRDRRERVEDIILHKLLLPGSVMAHFVAIDGNITAVEHHVWGSEEGKHAFEHGYVELEKNNGDMTVRPLFITESDLEDIILSVPSAKQQENDVTGNKVSPTSQRFSQKKVTNWYKSYVERMHSNREKSSRDEDLDAVRKEFDIKIPRDFMRGLRRQYAPEEWTAKGAPKR